MQLTIHGTVHRLSAIRASPVYPSRVAFPPQLSGAIADPDGDEVDPTAYEWYEDGVSCVEYLDAPSGETRLGVYTAYTMMEDKPHIRPLCAVSEDEGVSCLFMDEDVAAVPLDSVKRILDPDYVFVSERQAGGWQGLGNPHGEHGETVYDLTELEISEGVTLVVSEGRDTERVL